MMVTDSYFLASDYDSIQLEDIKHVGYFEPILEHIGFIFHTSPRGFGVWNVQNYYKVW